MARILITGGAGFIGSHLCSFLFEKGLNIICMDNLITGTKDNISHLLGKKNFEFIQHDVTKYIDVDGKFDYILHFASPASPIDYLKYPIKTLKVGSLGTHNTLGLAKAKKAKFLLASTSEVYGDPLVNPQKEDYWGNVNCIGPRGVYDEAKRFAEAVTLAYHRAHKIDTKIVRIFNSILANEKIVVFNDRQMHLETIKDYTNSLEKQKIITERKVFVPAFDLTTYKISLYEVNALIKHPCMTDCYEISLRYGRKIKVTGDHSLFTKDKDEKPVPIPVRQLKTGNYVAIPSRLPVVERDFREFSVSQMIVKNYKENDLWNYLIISPALREIIIKRREEIHQILLNSRRFKAINLRNAVVCATNRYIHTFSLPLWVVKKLNINIPPDAKIRIFSPGAHIITPDHIRITDEILWLIGFCLAEGCPCYTEGKSYFLTFSSDDYLLDKAKRILENNFGANVIKVAYQKDRCPAIFIHSKILHFIFDKIFKVIGIDGFPSWVFQLPLSRLKYVLEGFKDGDGTHSGNKLGKELCFETASKKLADDLTYLLLRFGIIASVGKYLTTFKKRYGKRKFPFYRVTVCELSTFNILDWDKGVTQRLNAKLSGDLVWSTVRKIKKCKSTKYVYDFSVPQAENFIAGNGVCCHNTYGPLMRKKDGRAIPNFIEQALHNKPVTVFGDGSQTRSFCYISDMIDGIYRLMNSKMNTPVNIGNPNEISILELAKKIIKLTRSKSKIEFKELRVDDPKTRRPDISLAKRELNWEPTVKLEDGLRLSIDWFKGK